MPAPLMDEAVEFPDGTDATVSQMAKDVVTFLTWVCCFRSRAPPSLRFGTVTLTHRCPFASVGRRARARRAQTVGNARYSVLLLHGSNCRLLQAPSVAPPQDTNLQVRVKHSS